MTEVISKPGGRRSCEAQILSLISIYWHTRTIGTSVRYYYADGYWRTGANNRSPGEVKVPQDYVDFPGMSNGLRPPKSFLDELPPNVVTGHFAEKRAISAAARRDELRETLGDMVDGVSDAELLDPIYYSVFPNISPWGSFNPIFYRFRPYGNNPEECIHECLFMLPVPDGEPRPPAAKMQWLDLDDDYIDAPELGALAKVFNQDTLNLPYVQKGLHNLKEVIFANYGEMKPRHFHQLYAKWMSKD